MNEETNTEIERSKERAREKYNVVLAKDADGKRLLSQKAETALKKILTTQWCEFFNYLAFKKEPAPTDHASRPPPKWTILEHQSRRSCFKWKAPEGTIGAEIFRTYSAACERAWEYHDNENGNFKPVKRT